MTDLVPQLFPLQVVAWLGDNETVPEDLDLVAEGKTLQEYLDEPNCPVQPSLGIVVKHDPEDFMVRILDVESADEYDISDMLVIPLDAAALIDLRNP